MVTGFTHFFPFTDDSDREMSGLLAKVSARLSNYSVAVIFGGFQHFDLGVIQVGSRVAAAQVQ